MLILIAESKTMNDCSQPIDSDELKIHRPLFDNIAGALMEELGKLSIQELSQRIGISNTLAQATRRMIFEFPNKHTGDHALNAYTGVVFKALKPETLPAGAKNKADKHLRIISSIYGWLNPYDIIKPYRMEFKCKVTPELTPVYNYWKKDIISALCSYVKENKYTEILDLMPGDAAKCIDWKTVRQHADVWKISFEEIVEGRLKTPNAGKLKKLRGTLLRQILTEDIKDISDLSSIENDNYIYEETDPINRRIRFLTA